MEIRATEGFDESIISSYLLQVKEDRREKQRFPTKLLTQPGRLGIGLLAGKELEWRKIS